LCTSFPTGEIEAEVAAAVEFTGRLGEQLGHTVDWVEPDWGRTLAAMVPMAAPSMANRVDVADIEALEPRNQEALRRDLALTVFEHYRMIERARAARLEFLRLWADIDVLIVPVAGIVAPPVDWAPWDQSASEHHRRFADFANFAMPFNLTGQPAMSLPLAWSEGGLPIGVQLVGRPLDEAVILNLAAQFEQASPWLERMRSVSSILS
jgi:amidase